MKKRPGQIDPATLVTLAAVMLSSAGAVVAYIGRLRGRVEALEKTLGGRITALEVKMEPLWKVITEELPRMLIRPHTPEFDGLVAKFLDRTITLGELERLRDLTRETVREEIDLHKRKVVELPADRDSAIALMLFLSGVEARITELRSPGASVSAPL